MPQPTIGIPTPFRDKLLIAAIFTLAIHEQRRIFIANEGREPTQEEMESIRNGLFNEWTRTAAQFDHWLGEGRTK